MKSRVVAVWRYWAGWYEGRPGRAAQGICSQHGKTCANGEVVASVQLADADSDDIRWAVCRPGLATLTGSDQISQNFPPGYKTRVQNT